jgi:hypothetical protein
MVYNSTCGLNVSNSLLTQKHCNREDQKLEGIKKGTPDLDLGFGFGI